MMIDEEKYPIAWRFNSSDCLLSNMDKSSIVFLNKYESEKLWDLFFPFHVLMKMEKSFCTVIEKVELDFDSVDESADFFEERLKNIDVILFFWGRGASAILPKKVLVRAWDDFFYPSDESSIILIPNQKKIIFSYEETFFYAEVLK